MTRLLSMGCLAGLVAMMGCSSAKISNTARTAKEQLLISNSIDQALSKVDFSAFGGSKVFIDEKYLDCVDKQYLVGSVRHRVLLSGAQIVPKSEEAEIIVEVRSGGVGTNTSDTYVGTPELSVPGVLPVSIPEVRLLSNQEQIGIAKIGILAYDAKTGKILGDGGMSMAQSDDSNWYFLGAGPYQRGSIQQEIKKGIDAAPAVNEPLPYNVAFDDPNQPTTIKPASNAPAPSVPGIDRVQWANSTDEAAPFPPAAPPAPVPGEFGNE